MNSQVGSVVSVDVDSGVVIVRPESPVACARCAAGRGCGAGLTTASVRDLSLPLEPGATVPAAGDRVALTLPSGSLLRAASVVYGWPLLAAVGMTIAGSMLTESDAILGLFALAGLGAGFLLARRQANRRCLMPSVSPL